MINYKSNQELLEELNKYVVGHITAKKVLISLVNRSKIRCEQKWSHFERKDTLLKPSKCLLIGPSGAGKSWLVECLSKIANFPFVRIDATQLNPTGAGGGTKPEEIYRIIHDNALSWSHMNKGYAATAESAIDQTVVLIDEIDKLASSWEGSAKSWNRHTQSHFLNIFENSEEMAGVSFIFAGAFSGLDKMKEQESKSIGFTGGRQKTNDCCLDDLIVKYGLIPELVGRINNIVELDKFTKEDYLNILKDRLLPEKENEHYLFNFKDHDLTYEQLIEMANLAEKSGQGIRYLKRALNQYFTELEFSYEERLTLDFDNNDTQGKEMVVLE